MSGPQLEDGYVRIANELVEALARVRLAGQECQVVWTVIRKTYGFNKKADQIPLGQIHEMTGISRVKASRLIHGLVSKKILSITNNGDRKALTIGINKQYADWRPIPKKGNIPNNGDRSIPQNGNSSIPIIGDLKRQKTIKDNPHSNSNGGAPPELVGSPSFDDLFFRYSSAEKETIREAFQAIARTRTSGKVKDSILISELSYWSEFETWKVIGGIRKYIDEEHFLAGKKENYLRGIIRNFRPEERRSSRPCSPANSTRQKTGTLLDSVIPEEIHAAD